MTKEGKKDFSEWNLTKSKKDKFSNLFLGIQAQNCIAVISREEVQKHKIALLEETKVEHNCIICMGEIKEGKALDCEHHFCTGCIDDWLQR